MEEKLIAIIAQKLNKDPKTITKNSKLIHDLGADSLDIVELLMTLEENYGIIVPDEDALNFVTIGDVLDFLKTKIQE